MGVGDRVFARRTKCRAFGRWKSMWKRRRSLLWASLKFSKKSVKSKVILRWKKATRNSITDHVVASAVADLVDHAEATWFVCKGDTFRNLLEKKRGMRALARRVSYMKDFRELERTADVKYRDFCFKRWRRIAKTHFEYVYAALLIQNRIRIRFAKRILRSKVRMVLAKQAVQRDKLEAAIATLYHAALPLQRLWRGYRGKSEYSAFQAQVWAAFRELQARVRNRGIQESKEKVKDLEYYWDD